MHRKSLCKHFYLVTYLISQDLIMIFIFQEARDARNTLTKELADQNDIISSLEKQLIKLKEELQNAELTIDKKDHSIDQLENDLKANNQKVSLYSKDLYRFCLIFIGIVKINY